MANECENIMVLTTVRSSVGRSRRWRGECALAVRARTCWNTLLIYLTLPPVYLEASGWKAAGVSPPPSLIAPCLIIVKLIENYILADLPATRARRPFFSINFYPESRFQRPPARGESCAILLNGDLTVNDFFFFFGGGRAGGFGFSLRRLMRFKIVGGWQP